MLPLYLIKNKIVTGPLQKNTSYSRLDVIRRYLIGLPQFQGGESFLKFGAALHEVFLENKFDTYNTLTQPEQRKINRMVAKLKRHPIVRALVKDSINEDKRYGFIDGVQLAYILDNKQPPLKRGADLKTTVCKTQKDFEQKAIDYGYIKQAHVYKKMENLKSFYFYAINKEEPHDIFILDVNKFKLEEKYAEKEIEWLVYFYKHYGNFYSHNITEKPMAAKGKETMSAITTALKQYLDGEKIQAKLKASIIKAVNKFPKDEKKLFQEKLDNIIKKLNGKTK